MSFLGKRATTRCGSSSALWLRHLSQPILCLFIAFFRFRLCFSSSPFFSETLEMGRMKQKAQISVAKPSGTVLLQTEHKANLSSSSSFSFSFSF